MRGKKQVSLFYSLEYNNKEVGIGSPRARGRGVRGGLVTGRVLCRVWGKGQSSQIVSVPTFW